MLMPHLYLFEKDLIQSTPLYFIYKQKFVQLAALLHLELMKYAFNIS